DALGGHGHAGAVVGGGAVGGEDVGLADLRERELYRDLGLGRRRAGDLDARRAGVVLPVLRRGGALDGVVALVGVVALAGVRRGGLGLGVARFLRSLVGGLLLG